MTGKYLVMFSFSRDNPNTSEMEAWSYYWVNGFQANRSLPVYKSL